AISPASSVPLLPWPKITVAPGVAASHFFAAFSSVKKKSTGNLVMNPSFTGVAACLVGFATAVAASTAVAARTVAKTAPANSLFLRIVRPFVRQTGLAPVVESAFDVVSAALQWLRTCRPRGAPSGQARQAP